MKALIKHIPIPTAGLALGLASLGILLQPYSEVLHIATGALSSLLVVLLLIKIAMYPRMIREDLKSPIAAGVLGTLFMTIMQLATYLAPFAFGIALALWSVAILGHVCLIVWFTITFIRKLQLKQVFPSYFIAYVGITVASLTSPVFGMEALGTTIYWFGFACLMALLVLVTYRYSKHEVPEPAKPLFCIYAAPISLTLAAYLSISAEPSMGMIITLTILAQLLLLVVLTQLPKLLRLKFYPSYASMTFPFVVCASALTKATAYFASLGANEILLTALNGLAIAETVFATGMVLFVLIHYVRFFARARRVKVEAAVVQTSQSSVNLSR